MHTHFQQLCVLQSQFLVSVSQADNQQMQQMRFLNMDTDYHPLYVVWQKRPTEKAYTEIEQAISRGLCFLLNPVQRRNTGIC